MAVMRSMVLLRCAVGPVLAFAFRVLVAVPVGERARSGDAISVIVPKDEDVGLVSLLVVLPNGRLP
jgi:hypothetical protein